MTISGDALLELNGGILQQSLFPDLNLGGISVVLGQYVTAGYALAAALESEDQNEAARRYGYWQAYERRLEQLAGHGRGQIALTGQFSVGTTSEQIAELRRKADFWKGQLELLVPVSSDATPNRQTLPGASRSTSNTTSW